jgi:hypothetical protein
MAMFAACAGGGQDFAASPLESRSFISDKGGTLPSRRAQGPFVA